MSYAISADEPSGLAPAALSALVHGVLLAVLVFGLHWQSRHPDAVEVELWSQLPEVEPPRVEPGESGRAQQIAVFQQLQGQCSVAHLASSPNQAR